MEQSETPYFVENPSSQEEKIAAQMYTLAQEEPGFREELSKLEFDSSMENADEIADTILERMTEAYSMFFDDYEEYAEEIGEDINIERTNDLLLPYLMVVEAVTD